MTRNMLSALSLRPALSPVARRWMSAWPSDKKETGIASERSARRKKVTIQHLHQMRQSGTPIAMVTAYDFPTGRACDSYGADITLVGDSLAQVCLGYDSTTKLTLDEMLHHCRAVARGSKLPFLVADMPFGSYHTSPEEAVRNAVRLVQEGGVEAVKLEGGEEIAPTVRRLTSIGIPVMAHVGLLPQRHTALSGYRVQGKDAASARSVYNSALALEDAGAFSVVLEAIPHILGTHITNKLSVPTIGIGAGPNTSGQVLVWDDLMARWHGHKAKFVRRFADVQTEEMKGVSAYVNAVKTRAFPEVVNESYEMDETEWRQFLEGVV
ncbi:ketopantoate hydroxymethyltransferase [Heliocybe sulcata]|uniref:3-methyl-2-oxobutanoate hydroxymethyltransferase n=1 Tax=Heliocybe sulcata TaxID=5364 RepID=A0A5C3N111_9AGAM|nr:ketopantoate hydroxymethyltransferase [Heliocybe sulcata]